MSDRDAPGYVRDYLAETRKFLDSAREDTEQLEAMHKYLPSELYELIFRLTVRPCVDPVIVSPDNERVVLAKRTGYPNPGIWNLPGGQIRYGETPEEAAVKKAKEETGLDATIDRGIGLYGLIGIFADYALQERGIWTRHHGIKPAPHSDRIFSTSFGITYMMRPNGGTLISDAEGEARYFAWDELPDEIGGQNKEAIDVARQFVQSR